MRRYTVADRLQQIDHFDPVEFNGTASGLQTALRQLKHRYEGQPLAGIILLSDGIATDATGSLGELAGMPPVFPILPPDDTSLPDVAIGTVIPSRRLHSMTLPSQFRFNLRPST